MSDRRSSKWWGNDASRSAVNEKPIGTMSEVTMSTSSARPYSKVTLWEVLRSIDEISTLPHVAVRVLQVMADPNSGASDLKAAMEVDPALCARVMRCVNSSAYAVRQRITNLQQAITFLGAKQVRSLAFAATVSDLFRIDGGLGSYSRARLWRHMVAVGICSRMIANRLRFANPEEVFLAGLMHDVGIILEDQFAHQPFCRMIGRSLSPEKGLTEWEHEYFCFDHTILGAKFAERWGFPDLVGAAIGWHHQSLQYDGPDKLSVRVVELANLICSTKGITSVGMNLVEFLDPEVTGLLLKKEDLPVLAQEVDEELARHAGLFDL